MVGLGDGTGVGKGLSGEAGEGGAALRAHAARGVLCVLVGGSL